MWDANYKDEYTTKGNVEYPDNLKMCSSEKKIH